MGGLGGLLGLTAIRDGRPSRAPAPAGTAKGSREMIGTRRLARTGASGSERDVGNDGSIGCRDTATPSSSRKPAMTGGDVGGAA